MSTSGQRRWTLNTEEVIREALERVGGEQTLGGEALSARRSLNIVITELINDGVNLFQLQEVVVTTSASQGTYTLPTSVVDVLEMSLRRGSIDIPMERIGFSDYLQIPNKTVTGRPFQYFVNRRYDAPEVMLWPLPTSLSVPDALYMWRSRRIEDVTRATDDLALPFRFMPVLAAGVAYHMAVKRTGIPQERITLLEKQYIEAKVAAQDEDRDRLTLRLQPGQGWVL